MICFQYLSKKESFEGEAVGTVTASKANKQLQQRFSLCLVLHQGVLLDCGLFFCSACS
jgi:hypothetical protein